MGAASVESVRRESAGSIVVNMELSGRCAFVTGATGAIGRSLSLALAQAGADVAVLGRDAEKLALVVAEIQALGRVAYSVSADLTQAAEVRRAVAEVIAAFAARHRRHQPA